MNKIVILDRDGVINIDLMTYVTKPAEFEPISGSLEAISLLNKNGFMLLEFGGGHQVEAISDIFESRSFNVKFYNDLQGNPRIVEVNLLP